MTSPLLCPSPKLSLDASGVARADDVGDIYFSAEDGWAETQAVFLKGAGLPNRWRPQARHTVAELGLGTGLNVLALLDLWQRHRPSGGRLDIVSFEGRPLRTEQAQAALACWSDYTHLAPLLMEVWPPPWKGAHRRRIDSLGVTLTVYHGEIDEALPQSDFLADTWFLDGFAPSKNPEMWSADIMAQVARLSALEARVATFTVAGAVRRGLEDAGFEVHKRPGYGKKRERLEAIYRGARSSETERRRGPKLPEPITIVGGGVAAASMAHALAARGGSVQMVAHGGLAAGASGGPMGLLTPHLEAADRPHVRGTLAAFAYSRHLFQGWEGFYPEGVYRFALDDKRSRRFRKMGDILGPPFEVISGAEAAHRTGVSGLPEGLWIGSAAKFAPKRLVAQLAGGVERIDAEVKALERSSQGWVLRDSAGGVITQTPVVVLAGGAGLAHLVTPWNVNLNLNYGRVSIRTLDPQLQPKVPVTWGQYMIPTANGLLIGATHERTSMGESIQDIHTHLAAKLGAACPHLADGLGEPIGEWLGTRATSNDRRPLAGEIDDGLWILCAFGGRGFSHAPLLAEMLASEMEASPAVFERNVRAAFHPARWDSPQT